MFREIRSNEKITEEDRRRREDEIKRNQAYLAIKPETEITVNDSKAFWNQMFMSKEA